MSSHHFVKEGQEPGLLILDWVRNAHELIDQLAQWAPKIIVHERALEIFLSHGYKADVVLYDNEVFCTSLVQNQFPIEIIPAIKGLNSQLEYVIDNVVNRCNVISHVSNVDLEMDTVGLVFYGDADSFHYIKNGFEKWLPKQLEVELHEQGNVTIIKGEDGIFTYRGQGAYFKQKH